MVAAPRVTARHPNRVIHPPRVTTAHPGGEPAVVLAVSVLIGSIGFKLVGDGIAVLF
jgi:hypothetical protein